MLRFICDSAKLEERQELTGKGSIHFFWRHKNVNTILLSIFVWFSKTASKSCRNSIALVKKGRIRHVAESDNSIIEGLASQGTQSLLHRFYHNIRSQLIRPCHAEHSPRSRSKARTATTVMATTPSGAGKTFCLL